MRDRLIHTLRLARGRWYQYRDKPSLEEALADAILAEFVMMDKHAWMQMAAYTNAAGRELDRYINESNARRVPSAIVRPGLACPLCGERHPPDGGCV